VGVAVEDGTFVVGGGAIEMELASKLRKYAATVGGRKQLAIEAFTDALEVVPKTLAESAGLDQIDTLVELRAEHEKGNKYAGLNVHTGKVTDMQKIGVIEPARIKTQAIGSAAEAAIMILRIDDVIAGGKLKEGAGAGGPPGGMPGGMGY
jgi:chaperonin GroEL (HSP60 family)